MREYITPMVLAATVGMCTNVRPVHCIVVTNSRYSCHASAEELCLPAGTGDIDDSVEEVSTYLESWKIPCSVESDIQVRTERFHTLVDKDFLGVLTPDEGKELEVLTQWYDNQKNAFYREIATVHEVDKQARNGTI